jgi:hypothetical protein
MDEQGHITIAKSHSTPKDFAEGFFNALEVAAEKINSTIMSKRPAHSNGVPLIFLGNRPASALDLIGPDGLSLRRKYLIGDPRDCPFAPADVMKKNGYVGIYRRAGVVK